MARLLSVIGIVSILFLSSPSHADSPPLVERLYGEVHLALAGARHSDLDFYPGFVSFSGGAWIRRGIGIDVFVDEGVYDSSKGFFDFEITNASGIAGRFQSPSKNGFFAYVLLGLVQVRVVQDESTPAGTRSVVQNYQGGRISVGIGQQLSFAKNVFVTGEYRNYFVDTELQLDALSLGVRLSFQ